MKKTKSEINEKASFAKEDLTAIEESLNHIDKECFELMKSIPEGINAVIKAWVKSNRY